MEKFNNKVAVAMSGGVDSSVAAALCIQKYGKENVFGITMKLFCYGEAQTGEKSCCSLDAISDAKAVCKKLGIAHYVLDAEKEFEKAVIRNFISEYKKGRTPIPCIPCNTVIKFDWLLSKVQSLGADLLATGHYARVQRTRHSRESGNLDSGSESGMTYQLLRGVDKQKDQSYFLYGMSQKQLAHTIFPLGEMEKSEVRKLAAKMKLKTAKKRESQGICFVTEGRVADWMRDKVKIRPGKIVDVSGNVVGEHEGVIFYTVGQRKRIPGGYPEPMYVVRIDAKANQVTIGTKKDLYGKELVAEKVHWISGSFPKLSLKCKAKIRYNMDDAGCIIKRDRTLKKSQGPTSEGCIKVVFTKPQRAITPGQSVVFYDKEVVIGGGIIRDYIV